MTKPRKPSNDMGNVVPDAAADALLASICQTAADIAIREDRYNDELRRLTERHQANIGPFKDVLAGYEKQLVALMKASKAAFFCDTDVVNLPHGSLIHAIADKVRIPKDALGKCEELGFDEVIKIAKSLDREAVEKWPDEKLFLIGAERKPREEFSYDLKKETPCDANI